MQQIETVSPCSADSDLQAVAGHFITSRFITKWKKQSAAGAVLTGIVRCSHTT